MERSRLGVMLFNFPARFLLFHGLALIATPLIGFSDVYESFFDVLSKNEWGFLCVLFGGLGFISLYLDMLWLYRLTLLISAAVFMAHAFIFLFSGGPTGFTSYLNVALNCVFIASGLPVYGFFPTPIRRTPHG